MKYVIRRTLLQVLCKFYCPQDLNTVVLDDRLQLLNADPAQVLREWNALTDAGYLLVVQGYPDYRSIERKTRVKLHLTVDAAGGTNKITAGIVVDVIDGDVYLDLTPAALAVAELAQK